MTSDLVTLERFSNGAIAQLLADLLRDAGIPVYIDGSQLQDEWAMSQKMMGLLSTELQVPRDRLDEAREILASVRASAEAPDSTGESPGNGGDDGGSSPGE